MIGKVLMAVCDIDDMTAHGAAHFFPVKSSELFFDVPKAEKKNKREQKKELERKDKKRNAKGEDNK